MGGSLLNGIAHAGGLGVWVYVVVVCRLFRALSRPPLVHKTPLRPLYLRRRGTELVSPRIVLMNPDCRVVSLWEQGRLGV